MAKLAKGEELHKEQHGTMTRLPVGRSGFPLNLLERMDDILGERWSPWLAIRRAEDLLRMPPVDVYEEGDQVVVMAEIPGLKREEINVEAAGRAITISGKKEKEERVEKKDYFRLERSTGAFGRSVPLPAEIQVESVTAQLKDGVLEIRAPKLLGNKGARRNVEVT
jgi:HSP20 family protein